jgi:hypothetical protein
MHISKICILESAVTMHIPEICIFVKCVTMHIRKYAYHKNPATMTMNIRNMHSHRVVGYAYFNIDCQPLVAAEDCATVKGYTLYSMIPTGTDSFCLYTFLHVALCNLILSLIGRTSITYKAVLQYDTCTTVVRVH